MGEGLKASLTPIVEIARMRALLIENARIHTTLTIGQQYYNTFLVGANVPNGLYMFFYLG